MSTATAIAELRAMKARTIFIERDQTQVKAATTTVFVRLMRGESYVLPELAGEFKIVSGRVWMVKDGADAFLMQGDIELVSGSSANPADRTITAIGTDPVVITMVF